MVINKSRACLHHAIISLLNAWAGRKRIPGFQVVGFLAGNARVRVSASTFVRSLEVLDPLLTPAMRAHPAWASWAKLVKLYSLVVQHELSVADIERIDDLVLAHSAQFDQVP